MKSEQPREEWWVKFVPWVIYDRMGQRGERILLGMAWGAFFGWLPALVLTPNELHKGWIAAVLFGGLAGYVNYLGFSDGMKSRH